MAIIKIRGEDYEVPDKTPTDIHIPEYNILVKDSILAEGVVLWSNVNIYGAEIGQNVKISAFVEIRKGVKIGRNTKIEPLVFIPEGVTIGECVFIGPNVIFTNDIKPRSCDDTGKQITEYEIIPTIVEDFASIGAGAVIRCGVRIGRRSLIGMGSIVVKDVPPETIVYGEAARVRRKITE